MVWLFFYKFQHTFNIRPRNSIPGHFLKRNDNICQHKDLYLNIHSSFFHFVVVTQLYMFFKPIELFILKEWTILYVNYTSMNLTCKKHFIPKSAFHDSIEAYLNTSSVNSHSSLSRNSSIISLQDLGIITYSSLDP